MINKIPTGYLFTVDGERGQLETPFDWRLWQEQEYQS